MDLNSVYAELKSLSEKTMEHVLHELRQIRTGQITPAIVEDLEVGAYGSNMRMKELASIATEGPATLVISPFDASIIQDIERAIHSSPLQLSPRVDGHIIRITMAQLTQEQREKFARLASEKIEEGKIQLRRHRDDARKDEKKMFENKEITEDDKTRAEKEIDIITKDFSDKLDVLKEKKQAEIMSV